MKVKNTAACVVSIGGAIIIPPLGTGDVDPEHRGVQRLLERGALVPVSVDDVSPADDAPDTVAELKEALTTRGIGFPDNARKAELQALYDGAKGQ